MLTGQEQPDSGTLSIGDTVEMGYVGPVARTRWDPNRRSGRRFPVAPTILEFGKTKMNSRAYVGAFNFKGGDQQKKVGSAIGRRAQSRASGQDAEIRRQPAAA
ncbi:MAG: hypothetical protein WDM89_05585 [Rhizomicrobium sp.]